MSVVRVERPVPQQRRLLLLLVPLPEELQEAPMPEWAPPEQAQVILQVEQVLPTQIEDPNIVIKSIMVIKGPARIDIPAQGLPNLKEIPGEQPVLQELIVALQQEVREAPVLKIAGILNQLKLIPDQPHELRELVVEATLHLQGTAAAVLVPTLLHREKVAAAPDLTQPPAVAAAPVPEVMVVVAAPAEVVLPEVPVEVVADKAIYCASLTKQSNES